MDKNLDKTLDLVEDAMEAIGKEDWENESDLVALKNKRFTYYHVGFDMGSMAMEHTGGFYYEDADDLHAQLTKAIPRIFTPQVLEMFTEKRINQIGFKFDNQESFSGEKLYDPNEENNNG